MTTLRGYRPPTSEAIHPRSNVRHWYLTWGQVTLADGVLPNHRLTNQHGMCVP